MISWIQRSFQHHFKAVFGILLAVTIVSFILTIGASPGIGRGGESTLTSRDFFGRNLAAPEDMQRLMEDATISIEFQLGGYAGVSDDQLKNYALQRVAALHIADQLHIPPATPDEMTTYIKSLRIFAGENGEFDPQRYTAFRQSMISGSRASEADAARVVSDDIRIHQVNELLDGPGYVLAGDVKDALLHDDTQWTVSVATVDYAAYTPKIEPTEADLEAFFKANGFRYEIQPRAVVGAITFSAASHLTQVPTPTEAEIRAYYDANQAQFSAPKPAAALGKDGKPIPAAPSAKPDPDAGFKAVHSQVEAALTLERARNLAVKDGSDFAFDLYQDKVARSGLDAYLASHKLAMKELAPFTQEEGPKEFAGSKDVAEAAFKLSPDRYFSEAIPVPDGAVVLISKEILPARQPLLTEVQAKVRSDYIDDKRRQMFTGLGKTLQGVIEERLKAGDSFNKAAQTAAAADSVKIAVKAIPAFSLRTPPKDVNDVVLNQLEHLNKGGVSDMAVSDDKGYLVYAKDKNLPDLSPANPKYAETRGELASYSARFNAGSLLTQMVDQELKRTQPAAGE